MPKVAADGVQVGTGTLLVTVGAGQVVAVNEFPAAAPDGVQVATGTFEVVTVLHVVAT